MTKNIFLFIISLSFIFSENVYDTKFLLSSSNLPFSYWRKNDNSLLYFNDQNLTVFYNFSNMLYQNKNPSNHSLAYFENTNISNQDSLLYCLYDDFIQIYSFDFSIKDDKIQISVLNKLSTIANTPFLTFSNINDILIFQLFSQEISLFSDSHKISSEKYYVFCNYLNNYNETIQKILARKIQFFIYLPIYIENNFGNLEISLKPLRDELTRYGNEKQLKNHNVYMLAFSYNYSIYYYSENKTLSIRMNQILNILNYYNYDLISNETSLQGFFISNVNSEISDINFIVFSQTDLYFFNADFENKFLHYLGTITINNKFLATKIVDSPLDNIFTVILSNYLNSEQKLFLNLDKRSIFSRNSISSFDCRICNYYNFYTCNNINSDCSIILNEKENPDNNPYFKIWFSVLVSIFSLIILIICCCFLVQRFCIGKNMPPKQIQNYDEVEERLKSLDKKKMESLMRKYSIKIEEKNMENSEQFKQQLDNKCPICMELLPSQPITYFPCKTHIVHVKCLILYEEETENNGYKCPFRCT